MTNESTIELIELTEIMGNLNDLPSLSPRVSLTSRIRALITKFFNVPQMIHLYGALGLNKTLTFDSGYNRVVSLFSDGSYLYAGTYSAPGCIVKIYPDTFNVQSMLYLSTGNNYAMDMVSDGIYVYVMTMAGNIVKINILSFTETATLNICALGETPISMVSDGTYLYVGIYNSNDYPGKVIRISISSFTVVDTLTLAVDETEVRKLILDGLYLYVGTRSVTPFLPKLVKISISTFTKVTTLTLNYTNYSIMNLFSDGLYLYAGLVKTTAGNAGILLKIEPETFTDIQSIPVSSYYVTSMFIDVTNIYMSLNTDPGQIVVINIASFNIINTITLDTSGVIYALYSDGIYLYAGLYTSPGKVTRRYIIPSADMQQRKIDITKECIQSIVSATTSNGLATTLIDTARTEGDNYWKDMTVLILGGAYKGQSRRISGFDAASDTITVSPAFNGAIESDVRYAILPDIKGYTNNLVAAVTNGIYSHSNGTIENDVLIFTGSTQDINLYLDMVNITQTSTIREYIKVDGATYRQLTAKVFPSDFDTATKAISLSFKQSNRAYKITLQSATAEGAAINIPYTYRTESRS